VEALLKRLDSQELQRLLSSNVTFEACQYEIDSLSDGMVDVAHDVSTHPVFLQRLTLTADLKLVRESFSVSDAN
jgi:hypothetical protein